MNRSMRSAFVVGPSNPLRLILVWVAVFSTGFFLTAAPAGAGDPAEWILDIDRLPVDVDEMVRANPAFVVDGSFAMNVGNLHMHICNYGFIGSLWPVPYRWAHAASAQWPAGSGNEYMYAAGLWVGGRVLGQVSVSTAAYNFQEIMAQINPEDTIYEAIGGKIIRPPGNTLASGRRFPEPDPNDDGDYDPDYPWVEWIDEETLNGYDDDGDGLIDEDFAQIGNQMFVTTMYDNTPLAIEWFPDHRPLNIKVVQESYAWENPLVQDFVGFDYTITNVGVTSINDIYLGMVVNASVTSRDIGGSGMWDDMAGSFSGPVRASDGTWQRVQMGFVWDAAEDGALTGYFGVVILGHTIDPQGARAPRSVNMHTFQIFQAMTPFQSGGWPTNDDERYEAMTETDWDADVVEDKEDNYAFLVTVGPFPELEPDEDVTFQLAFVAGDGLDGLKRNAAEALATFQGAWFDTIGPQDSAFGLPPVTIGVRGRETMVCEEDFPNPAAFRNVFPDFFDVSCAPSEGWLAERFERVQDEDVFFYPRDWRFPGTRSRCIMVNLDSCLECFHRAGRECVEEADFDAYWRCHEAAPEDPAGCTGIGGRETRVTWLVGMAPPPPGIRVWPTDRQVHIFWDNTSEITPDLRLNEIDFQSYKVWRADNWTRPFGTSVEGGPPASLWQLIAEFDKVDSFLTVHEISPTQYDSIWLPLGRNTGLEEIRYRPAILDDPRFEGLADSMRVVASRDTTGLHNEELPLLFTAPGQPNWITEPILRWQGYPAVLDTFWAVTARRETTYTDPMSGQLVMIAGKDPIWYYEYIDPFVHNGFLYFYSVTATDHELERIPGTDPPQYMIKGPGLAGDPAGGFMHTSPARRSQTAEQRAREGANIFVYPNPATRSALEEFQQLFPSQDDPTGVRVNFANLPEAHNTINIYTVSGDLVQVIEHDGTGGYGEVSWNLISRNGQEVVSGIYLYTVQSAASGFDDYIGKFVVVR